ncbi:MAG: hypothetical protein CHACPFDD_01542 [Phycisphaerae bacterium]|nr:hypothetical protein [Phycisphaerae bacterium]
MSADRIVQVGNFKIACYDKSGVEQWRAKLGPIDEDSTTWSSVDFWDGSASDRVTDARVLFDQFSNRFVVTTIEIDIVPCFIDIAISKTATPANSRGDYNNGDPEAAWYKFRVNATLYPCPPPDEATPYSIDYPTLAVTGGAGPDDGLIVITSRETGGAELPQCFMGHGVHFLRKPPTGSWTYDPIFYASASNYRNLGLVGPANVNNFVSLPMPAHFFGTVSPETVYVAQIASFGQQPGVLRLTAVTNVWAALTKAQHDLSVDQIDQLAGPVPKQLCPPPTGSSSWIDPTPGNIQSVAWRNGRLYCAYEHFKPAYAGGPVTRFVARWNEIDLNGWPHSGQSPTVRQKGVLDGGRVFYNAAQADDRPVHYLYPMLMPMPNGDISLFVSRAYEKGFMSLHATAHRAALDPLDHMGAALALLRGPQVGVTTLDELGRPVDDGDVSWGEYNGIALDPADGSRIWTVGVVGRCAHPISICTTCPGGGQRQGKLWASVGSYVASTAPTHVLTLRRPNVDLPSARIKIMPPDTGAQLDTILTSTTTSAQYRYAQGTAVTLRAPEDEDVPPYEFVHWLLDGEPAPPLPGDPRQVQVTMSQDHTVIPLFQLP